MSDIKQKCSVSSIDYYHDFKCLGSECPDSCCQGWSINIEEKVSKAFEAYDAAHGANLSDSLISTDKHTLIRFKDDGYCPHFDCNRLCSLYDSVGADNFPQVCDIYPRAGIDYRVGYKELITSLSCPVSVELAVFRDSPLSWQDNHTESSDRLILKKIACNDMASYISVRSLQHSFIKLLQRRDVSLNRRLTAVLLICHRGRDLDLNSSGEAITMVQGWINDLLKTNFKEIPELAPNFENQVGVLVEFVRALVMHIKNDPYSHSDIHRKTMRLFDESFAGIGLTDFSEFSPIHIENYIACQQGYVVPYFQQNPHVVENIFVHYFMAEGFPFTDRGSMLEEFMLPVLDILLITGLLGGYANYHKAINDDTVKRLIYLISRMTQHSEELKRRIIDAGKQLGTMKLGQIYTLFSR